MILAIVRCSLANRITSESLGGNTSYILTSARMSSRTGENAFNLLG